MRELERLICRAEELQLSLQVSVVGLIRLEWLAGEWKIRQSDRRGDRKDEL